MKVFKGKFPGGIFQQMAGLETIQVQFSDTAVTNVAHASEGDYVLAWSGMVPLIDPVEVIPAHLLSEIEAPEPPLSPLSIAGLFGQKLKTLSVDFE